MKAKALFWLFASAVIGGGIGYGMSLFGWPRWIYIPVGMVVWMVVLCVGCASCDGANRDAVQGKVARDYHLDNIRNEAGYNATDWSRHED